MRGPLVALVVLLVCTLSASGAAGVAATLPAPAPLVPAAVLEPTPHPGIYIGPDTAIVVAGHYNPLTGVVAGSGTSGDPYIIEGWSFTGGAPGTPALIGPGLEIYRNHGSSPDFDDGTTRHFVIRNNHFQDLSVGIRIHGSRHITIEHNTFSNIGGVAVHHEHDHFHYLTNGIHIRDNTIATEGYGIRLDQVGGNTVDYDVTRNDITVGRNGVGIYVRNTHFGTITIQDNDIQGGKVGIHSYQDRSGSLLYNRVRDTTYAGIIAHGSSLHIANNLLVDNLVALRLVSSLATTRIVDNHIDGNSVGQSGGIADASGNWWGDASGPGGDAGGSGDPVFAHGTDTVFAPWLGAPPAAAGPRA